MVDFGVQEGGSVGGAPLGFGVGFVKFLALAPDVSIFLHVWATRPTRLVDSQIFADSSDICHIFWLQAQLIDEDSDEGCPYIF